MDELTGLRELPEGHHWNVTETDWETLHRISQHDRTGFNSTNLRYCVSIIRTWEMAVKGYKKHWWGKPTEDRIEKYTETVATGYMPELTPETLRKKADEVMDNWEADKERKALLGNYPPKKLEP